MEGDGGDFFRTEQDYIIREIQGKLYRIEYISEASAAKGKGQIVGGANLILGMTAALVFCMLLFVRNQVLKPFEQLSEVPYALAKGNPAVPLQEERNRFFGKFVRGLYPGREGQIGDSIDGKADGSTYPLHGRRTAV